MKSAVGKETIMQRIMRYSILLLTAVSLNVNVCSAQVIQTVPQIKTEVLVKTSKSWDGKLLPDYPKGKPEITISRITVPAGAQLDMHKHLMINAGVLIEGELTVYTKDNKTIHLKAGDPLVEVVNTWHYGKNEGNTDAVIVMVYAGEQGKAVTVKEKEVRR